MRVLTDRQWAVLEPLIEACRPHRKAQHHDLRRTIEAIIWRCQNGAKWRSLPAEFGPWWMPACTVTWIAADGASGCLLATWARNWIVPALTLLRSSWMR